MIGFILIFCIISIINQFWLSSLASKHHFFNKNLLSKLYVYHFLFFLIYYYYALNNPSDSNHYYFVLQTTELSLWEILEIKNGFIFFIAYPFVKYLSFTYEMIMFLFSWFGYIGFVYSYLFIRENISINVRVFNYFDLLTLLMFLPNMHFWTVSLGKGSIIFMGIMLFTYAIKFPKKRFGSLIIGALIVFLIRPHVMLFILIGVMVGLLTGKEKIRLGFKIVMIISSVIFLMMARNSILSVANLEGSVNLVQDFGDFSSYRSSELSRTSGSGVNMSSYSLPFRLFTFWFRPLFFDAPGLLGIFTSFENLIYLLLFVKIINRNFLKFIRKAPYMVKMATITFLVSSFAMTFVMSNLGIIMRQKSMVMYFAFFVIYYFLAEEKYRKILFLKSINKL